jgi:uncharacterized protein (TIGR02996 family)
MYTLTWTEQAMLDLIANEPRDPVVRWVYADWLDEQGRELEASIWRVSLEWTLAGARIGWMQTKIDQNSRVYFHPRKGILPDVPAFCFSSWTSGIIATLPAPERSFGIDLAGTNITVAGLNELSHLRTVVVLNLYGTGRTEADVADIRLLLPDCRVNVW